MTKTTPKHGARKKFKLAATIANGNKTLDHLVIREPLLSDRGEAVRKNPTSPTAQSVTLLARLADVSEDVIAKVKTRDARRIQSWLAGLAVADDAEVDDSTGVRTFQLLVPLPSDGKPITSITIREPDLEAAIAAEKFDNEVDASAATIAHLSGTTIPIVKRMAMRDINRIEAWLLPFLTGEADGEDPDDDLAMDETESDTTEAGET